MESKKMSDLIAFAVANVDYGISFKFEYILNAQFYYLDCRWQRPSRQNKQSANWIVQFS